MSEPPKLVISIPLPFLIINAIMAIGLVALFIVSLTYDFSGTNVIMSMIGAIIGIASLIINLLLYLRGKRCENS